MNNVKIIIYCLMIFSFFSCTHDMRYPIAGNLEYTISYKPDSYIVLHDSILSRLDTLISTNYRTYSASGDHDINYREYASVDFTTNYDTVIKKNVWFTLRASGEGRYLSFSLFAEGTNLGGGSLYSEPFILGFSNNINTYDEYTVRGKVYKTVFESYGMMNSTNYYHAFYSLHDGLIKIDILNKGIHKVYEIEEAYIVR